MSECCIERYIICIMYRRQLYSSERRWIQQQHVVDNEMLPRHWILSSTGDHDSGLSAISSCCRIDIVQHDRHTLRGSAVFLCLTITAKAQLNGECNCKWLFVS